MPETFAISLLHDAEPWPSASPAKLPLFGSITASNPATVWLPPLVASMRSLPSSVPPFGPVTICASIVALPLRLFVVSPDTAPLQRPRVVV